MSPTAMVRTAAVLVAALGLGGCIMDALYGHLPNRVGMAPAIHPLAGLNSPWDDFNAVASPPPLRLDTLLVFANNSDSRGTRFQLSTGRLRLTQNPYPNRRQVHPPVPLLASERTGPFLPIPDIGGHLRGPTPLTPSQVPERRYEEPFPPVITMVHTVDKEPLPWRNGGILPAGGVWTFDSDREGKRNLYFVDEAGEARAFFGNRSDSDEAYASYDFLRHALYFASNRSGQWRIYRHANPSGDTGFSTWLGDTARAPLVEAVPALDAPGNTLAPFVDGDLMLFASDRPGGRGGFDLYLSRFVDDRWGAPQNLQRFMPPGVEINTAANEFRPSLLSLRLKDFTELRVLLFSSDRPGGQGGYDLYLTALPEFHGRPVPTGHAKHLR